MKSLFLLRGKLLALFLFFYLTLNYSKACIPAKRPSNRPKELCYVGSETVQEKTYRLVIKHCEESGVPTQIVFSILNIETGYRGPEMAYNPFRVSKDNSIGAMQIQLATAKSIAKKPIKKEALLKDISLNIEIGVKCLKTAYTKYGSWEKAVSVYNSGKPKINNYCKKVFKNSTGLYLSVGRDLNLTTCNYSYAL